jgi:gluconokinase
MEGAFGSTESIIGSGGALHASAAWTQIICDALQRPVTLPADGETTSRGAALVALEHIGAIDDIGSAPPCSGSLFRPDPRRAATYEAAVARQRDLEELLLPWLEKNR